MKAYWRVGKSLKCFQVELGWRNSPYLNNPKIGGGRLKEDQKEEQEQKQRQAEEEQGEVLHNNKSFQCNLRGK